ncbi:FAD-binding oxidoreductase, partial [bacterium]|nr:FAD-binding oxidoreductase [bacterium]
MNNTIQTVILKSELENTHPIKIVKSDQTIRDSYADYLMDESKYPDGTADELVFVYSENQIVQMIQQAFQSRIPVTISAGRTGIVGGAVPLGGTLLSLEGMNRFLGARWDEKEKCWFIRFQPGISLKRLQEMLDTNDEILQNNSIPFAEESDKWFYPPDPTEKSAHLGGTVATNASGARSLKYGQTRKYINGLRVVISDGSVISLKRGENVIGSKKKWTIQNQLRKIEIPVPQYPWPRVKNTAGYYASNPMDIIDLFIGSEGTLGIITEIEIALRKKPDFIFGGVVFFSSEKTALHFVQLTKKMAMATDQPINPTALEYFDDFSLQLLRKKSKLEVSNSKIPPFPDHAQAAIYF